MMHKPNDEMLVAYLDGELDWNTRAEVEAWLERDVMLRERMMALMESATLLRAAFDPALREPIPEKLLAGAHRESSTAITDLVAERSKRGSLRHFARPWMHWAAAAGVAGLLIGGGVGHFVAGPDEISQQAAALDSGNWLDNLAAYHKLFVSAGADDVALVDVPANTAAAVRKAVQKLPPDFRLPNLQPWGLQFQGARFLFVEGQPATQLFYTTDNKALGPLTVVVAVTNKPDLPPTFDRRDGLNMLYWRHHGHAYALVGTADIGYLWNISNDIAYQLDAI